MIIGAGVAGLAAIAASKALGAVVRVFDTRPVVKEQVQSLGAEFLEIDLEEDAEVTLRHHHSALCESVVSLRSDSLWDIMCGCACVSCRLRVV